LAVLAALGFLFSSLLPFRHETNFWRAGWTCLSCGMVFFVPVAIVFWRLLHQGAVLNPRLTAATAGLLAGLTGITVLEIHCVIQTAWHVMIWHLGVPAIGALLCLAIGWLRELNES